MVNKYLITLASVPRMGTVELFMNNEEQMPHNFHVKWRKIPHNIGECAEDGDGGEQNSLCPELDSRVVH
jgi:hypothetical protein